MYPTITEPELRHWLSQFQEGPAILESMTSQKVDLLTTLNSILETRVSAAQFKAALVTTYIKGRKDEAERSGMTVTMAYLLRSCRQWIRENTISRQQFEAALLQMGYSSKGLKKKNYRSQAAVVWG